MPSCTNPRPYVAKSGALTWYIRWRVPGLAARQQFTDADEQMVKDMKYRIEKLGCAILGSDPRVTSRSLVTGEVQTVRTFGTACREWIENGSGATPSTKLRYIRYLEQHLTGIADIPIGMIESETLVKLFRKLATKGSSSYPHPFAGSTLVCIWANLAATFAREFAAGRLSRNMAEVARPGLDQELDATRIYVDKFLTHEEWVELEPHFIDDPLLTAFMDVLMATGARWQEVAPLRVSDLKLDGDAPTVTIEKAVKLDRRTGKLTVGRCKGKSERTLVIDKVFARRLQAWVEGKPHSSLLFPSERAGKIIRYSNFYKLYWHPFVKRAKAAGFGKPLTIHMLRHTHGSWLLDITGDLHMVSLRLGHSDIRTTAKIYMHRLPRGDERTRQQLETMWADVDAARKKVNRGRIRAV